MNCKQTLLNFIYINKLRPTVKKELWMTIILLMMGNATIVFAMVDPETPTSAQPTSGGIGWSLVFSDEFNGTSLDTSKWTKQVSAKSRAARPSQGINDWWWKADNVYLDGVGSLVLDVIKHDSNTMYCGSINSNNKFEPTYGYYEARIRVADTTKSTHTAFWFQGDTMGNVDGTGNDGAEIDVFESAWFGDYSKSVVHIDGYGGSHQANTKQYTTPGLHSGYHVFGLEWTHDVMNIYYDGVFKVQYTGIWVPRVPEYVWLSDGASFGDVGTFTSEPVGWLTNAKVDYVRVWQQGVGLFDPELINPSFEDPALASATFISGVDDWWDSVDFTYTKDKGISTVPATPYGDNWTELGRGRWIYQQIGTYEENMDLHIRFLLGRPSNQGGLDTRVSLLVGGNPELAADVATTYAGNPLTGTVGATLITSSALIPPVGAGATAEQWVRLSTGTGYTPGSPLWLQFDIADTASGRVNIDHVQVFQVPGDLTGDGKVDMADMAELGAGWQTSYDMNTLLDVANHWLYGASL